VSVRMSHDKKEDAYYYVYAETVVDAIVLIDMRGTIKYCNNSAKKMFLYEDDIIDRKIDTLIPGKYLHIQQTKEAYPATQFLMDIGKTVEMTGLKKDGNEFPVEVSVSTAYKDYWCNIIIIIRDITDKKQKERFLLENCNRLETLAMRDSLTNLYNRRYALQVLENEINRAKRYQKSLSCLLIDVDYFKKVNDFYGHPFGDKVLIFIASFLQEMVRSTDVVARYGGEEFLVVLPEVNVHGAMDFAERLRVTIANREVEDTENNFITSISISIGVSTFQHGVECKETIISQADKALYEAKKRGRNRVCCYRTTAPQLV